MARRSEGTRYLPLCQPSGWACLWRRLGPMGDLNRQVRWPAIA